MSVGARIRWSGRERVLPSVTPSTAACNSQTRMVFVLPSAQNNASRQSVLECLALFWRYGCQNIYRCNWNSWVLQTRKKNYIQQNYYYRLWRGLGKSNLKLLQWVMQIKPVIKMQLSYLKVYLKTELEINMFWIITGNNNSSYEYLTLTGIS